MQIIINGEPTQCSDGLTVAGLLAELSLPAQRVAVEQNKQLVPRARHDQTAVNEGDELEIVTFVGGG